MEGTVFYFEWEARLILWLQAHMGSFGTALASNVSVLGEELIMIAIIGFLYWCRDKNCGKFVGTVTVNTLLWFPMVKNVFLRRRPYFDVPGVKCLKPVNPDADLYDLAAQGYSFPSGHATNCLAFYGTIAVYSRKRWAAAAALFVTLIVGVSRFCLGVHYPTDVLAGWVLGLFAVVLVGTLQRKVKNATAMHLVMLLAALPGWFFCSSDDYYTGFGMMAGFFLSFWFEEKYVRFANTKNLFSSIVRLTGGLAIYFALNTALKLPFSGQFLSSGTFAAHLVRALRYFIITVADMALYPMLFRFIPEPGSEKKR